MPYDFNPDLSDFEEEPKQELVIKKPVEAPSFVVEQTRQNKDMLSMGGLLGITKSHVEEDFACRETIRQLEQTLEDNYHLMGIKDILEYLKIKMKEREFHADCVFKSYAIMQKTDMAKEIIAGGNREKRVIEATDKSKVKMLLSKLNPNAKEEVE